MKSNSPELSIEEVKNNLKIKSLSLDELKDIIKRILENNLSIIKERGIKAMAPLMGDVMKEARGNIDGAIVSKELKAALTKFIEEI
jgi:glutamyl-tRNA(Gln) amidotransferase subunit E